MSCANPAIHEASSAVAAELRPNASRYEVIKPKIEFVIALLSLVYLSPVILLAMLLVRLSSRGPAIYTQKRLGLGGRVFTIYKIRTMYQNSERHSGPTWCVPGDPRITPIGRFLRWSHLDELPQLINIVRGEMSLIGPRPERPEFLDELDREFSDYRRRLEVLPGLSGLAQVQQPPDCDLDSVRRKLNYDLYYVDQLSLWLDFRIVLATILKCLGTPFNWISRILRLPDPNNSDDFTADPSGSILIASTVACGAGSLRAFSDRSPIRDDRYPVRVAAVGHAHETA
jgi:lipopolysaccharide/colanic/teichoic acid biosynthesis glycosyltransferase